VAANELPAIVVCDAGPLIHLDELRCLDILRACRQVLVPNRVWMEVRRHRPSALRRRRVSLTRVDTIPHATGPLRNVMDSWALDAGEREALQLMQNRPEAVLLTDDSAARAAALTLNHSVRGTIGMILVAWENGLRTRQQVLRLLRALPQRSTLHISRALLTETILRVQEGVANE
jgi:predicted nucleic acid-binding protein